MNSFISSDRKLIPLWYSLYADERKQLPFECCADHGCVGVDIIPRKDQATNQLCFDICTIKEQRNTYYLGSRTYSLPFLAPNEISELQDPCLANIDHEKNIKYKYLRKLTSHFNSGRINASSLNKNSDNIVERLSHEDTVSLNKNIVETARIYPENFAVPRANWLYTGNCLSVTSKNVLLHPCKKSLDQLAITSLIEQQSPTKSCKFEPGERQTVKLKGGPIYQLEYQKVMNHEFCFIRKRHVLNILELQYREDNNSYETSSICKLKTEREFCGASLSPHIPGEFASVTSDGELQLHTFSSSDPIWHCEQNLGHTVLPQKEIELYWCCDFGSHPRALLYLDRSCFTLSDLRAKRRSQELLLRNSSFFEKGEELFLFQQSQPNHFQHYVASSHHLVVVDERFPRAPVQIWKHQLSSFPFYFSQRGHPSFDDAAAGDQFLLLAGQRPQETACFQIRTIGLQPISLAPPWHCSAPSDAFKNFQLHGLRVPESVTKRISFPLMGVCSIPHSEGVTVLQMTSAGDTFYQDFVHKGVSKDSERTHRYCAGYKPSSATDEFLGAQSWISQAEITSEETKVQSNIEHCNLDALFKTFFTKRPVSSKCSLCFSPGKEPVSHIDICPSCELSSEDSKRVIDSQMTGRLLIEAKPIKVDQIGFNSSSDLKKYKNDPFSEKLMKIWDVIGTSDMDANDVNTEGDILRSYLIPEPKDMPTTKPFELIPGMEADACKLILDSASTVFIDTPKSVPLRVEEKLYLPVKNLSFSFRTDFIKSSQDSPKINSLDIFGDNSSALLRNFETKSSETVGPNDEIMDWTSLPTVNENKPESAVVNLCDSDDDYIPPTPAKQNVNKSLAMQLSFTRRKIFCTDGF